MKKRNITLWGLALLGCLFVTQAFAQITVNHPSAGNAGTFTLTPVGTFFNYYDPGGVGANYANGITNSVLTFAPAAPANKIKVTFTSFSTEGGWDFLTAYDGATTGAPVIASTSGTVPPTNMAGGVAQATTGNTSGALTFSFFSDGIFNSPGWAATVTQVVPPCVIVAPANVTASTSALTCDANVVSAAPGFNPAGCLSGLTLRYTVNGGAPVVVAQPLGANVTLNAIPLGVNVIVWQLVDPATGTIISTTTQTVTVVDQTPPTISCPPSLTFNLDPGACCQIVSWPTPTFGDNCQSANGPVTLLQQNVSFTNYWSGYTTDLVNLNNLQALSISNVNVQASLAGSPAGNYSIKVYMKVGTGVGFEANPAAWTLAGQITANVTAGFPTVLLYNVPVTFTIPAGATAGIAVLISDGTNLGVRVVAQSTFANSQTQDATLRINQAPGRWLNGNFGGVIFAGENPKPQMRVTYNLQGIPTILTQTGGPVSGSELCKGGSPYTISYKATDGAGLTATCSFKITILPYLNNIQTLVCNDLVYVSLDKDCTETLNADQVLEGGPYKCYDDYVVQIDKTPPYGNGPWVPAVLGPGDVGKTYAVQVIDPVTGNKCWGNIKVEDKLAPVLSCKNVDVACNFNPDPAAQPVTSSAVYPKNFSIGDATTSTATFSVPPGATINDINVVFKTNHTWVGDIDATLKSPTGTTVKLFDRPGNGGCAGDGLDVVFDDAATLTAAQFVGTCGNLPAIAGTYKPSQALSAFNGQPQGGTWTLSVTDYVGGDAGPSSFAQLNINSTTVVPGFPNGLTLGVNVFSNGPGSYTVLQGAGTPALENCSDVTLTYQDQEFAKDCASGLTKTVNRKWTAVDASGNTKTCIQVINFFHPTLADVTFPPDYDGVDNPAILCGSAYPTPAVLEGQGLQGFPHVYGSADGCTIGWTYTDAKITVCDGTYKILRTWTAVDWCAGASATSQQIIKVMDNVGPTIACPANLTVSTDPFTCCAQINLPDVIVSDNCSRINNISGMVIGIDPSTQDTIGMFLFGGTLTTFPGNNLWNPDTLAAFGTSPCLPQGTHTVVYQAEDDCGNTSTCMFKITVRDYVPPVASCDQTTVVAIGLDDPFDCYEPANGCDGAGVTWVKAATFDDHSYDNCNNIKFTIKRLPDMVTNSYSDCILALNSINGHPDCSDQFPDSPNEFERAVAEGDSIKFYCCEVGTTQMVQLTVYQLDAFGNFTIGPDGSPVSNSCMVEVTVQDKIKPVCVTPGNVTVSCESFDPSLWAYGKPAVYDNCCLDTSKVYQGQCGLEHSVNYNLFDTLCNRGTITRTFRVYDCHGQQNQCTQRIFVNYEQDYFVKFPNDVIVTVCDGTGNYGEPSFYGKDCELLGVTFEDAVFTVVPDACLKIERTWKIINWCTYNPNAGCVNVPNPNPNATSNSPQNLPGPIVSACGTAAPWNPTVVAISPGATPTNYCTFYDANANCYVYKQIIKIIDTQKPTVTCPASPVEYCDVSVNDPLLWNQSYWWDPIVGQHDLCEGDAPLTITATDACSGANVNISYLLFLDLDGDGSMETVVSSNNTPAPGTVNYNNLNTPSYGGGTPRVFDGRPVLPNEIYRWANHQSVSGTSRTASVQWKTFAQMPTPTNQVGSPGIAPQLPYGTHKIKWTITDGCGNETYCEYTFVVKDCKAPTVVCFNGLSVNIMPTQMVTMWASDFLQYAEDNCTPPTPYTAGPNKIKFAIRKKGQGTGFPVDALGNPITSVNFTCAELGKQFVELWAQDLAGNADFCETFIEVQDNNNNCSAGGTITVAGALKTETADGVADANVNVQAGAFNSFDMTDNQGLYSFTDLVPANTNYTVTPTKDDNPLNGVSTYDLVLISKHILGLEPLNTPYKMIAADANKSNSITTFDIVEVRKLILGIYNELPNNTSWRFVDKGFVFPQPNNPFSTAFPETKSVAGTTVDQLADDFVGVKIGDVNGTAIANAVMSTDDRSAGTMLFDVQDRDVKAGEVFEVNVKGAEKVQGYQFTMNFAGLEVADVVPGAGMKAENFGIFADAITTSVDGEANEFTVKFRAVKSGKLSQMLGVSSRITRAEAYSQSNNRMDVALRFNNGGVSTIAGVGFELYQNQPNPFVSKTMIGFHLPEATEATLSIYDETGRMLFTQKGQFTKGYNAIAIDRALLNTTGVMYYKLETATDAATKKMIQTK